MSTTICSACGAALSEAACARCGAHRPFVAPATERRTTSLDVRQVGVMVLVVAVLPLLLLFVRLIGS
jgi:hypothetical protein